MSSESNRVPSTDQDDRDASRLTQRDASRVTETATAVAAGREGSSTVDGTVEPPLRRVLQSGVLSNGPPPGEAEVAAAPRSQGLVAEQPSGSIPPLGARASMSAVDATDAADRPAETGGDKPRAPVKIPKPSRRDPLSDDLERELDAAMGGASLEELVAGNQSAALGQPLEIDAHSRGTIVKIHGDNVFFTLDGRNEGVASMRQFREPPKLGNSMDVMVTGYHAEDGLYEVNVPGASISVQDWDDVHEGAIVEARVTGANTGGLECMVGGLRGFIPASQIDVFRVEHLADYYEKKLLCVVTEANQRKKNLVLSHRAVLEREREEQKQQLLAQMAVGDVLEGVVTSIRDFGAFVDLGGVDGLIHISQLSWDRVNHPSEILEVGQRVQVKVEKINPDTGKIGLSYRDLLEHPWSSVEQRFSAGVIVKGTVTRVAKFGAFVKLAPGIEGLVHISELAHHRVVQVTNVVKEGDEVEVKILQIDPEGQRISLSLKDAHPMPVAAPAAEEPAAESDEPPRQPALPRRNAPLKGGTDRHTGGDSFGLKW